jgi:quercetin dioxygenase-like cupin family protein
MEDIMYKNLIAGIGLGVLSLGLYSASVAQQTAPPPPAAAVGVTPRALARTENNNMPVDFTADLRAFYIAPGGNIPLHYHPSPITLVVLEGELTYIEAGVEKTYKVGESWTEGFGPEHAHELWNKGKTMASFALMSMMPKGATLTTFVQK